MCRLSTGALDPGIILVAPDRSAHTGSYRSPSETLEEPPRARRMTCIVGDCGAEPSAISAHKSSHNVGRLVGRMSAFGSNSARSAPRATQEIAICRETVVPPGWIEQPTPGLGNLMMKSVG